MSLTNSGTPFNEDGWANLIADVRRLFLLVGGGSNDLNQASSDVNQDGITAGENANNAFKIRGVNVSTAAPSDGQPLTYSKARDRYEGNAGSGGGGTFLQAANNLNDVASKPTSRTNLGLGSAAVLSTTGVMLPGNNLSDVSNNATALFNIGLGTTNDVTHNKITATSLLTASSGVSLGGYLRLMSRIVTGNYAVGNDDCFIVASGVIVTLPTAVGRSGVTYFVASDPGATAQVDAQAGQTIRGTLTGVTLLAGKTSVFTADGTSIWYENRSA